MSTDECQAECRMFDAEREAESRTYTAVCEESRKYIDERQGSRFSTD